MKLPDSLLVLIPEGVVTRLEKAAPALVAWWMALPWMLVPPGAALLASMFCDFGEDARSGYYAALAGILPVLALAALIEFAFVLPPLLDEAAAEEAKRADETADGEDEDDERSLTATDIAKAGGGLFVYRIMGFVVVGEAAALSALADGQSSTFLAITALIAAAFQLVDITRAHSLGTNSAPRSSSGG